MKTSREKTAPRRKRKVPPGALVLLVWTFCFVVLPLGYVLLISFMERGTSGGVVYRFTMANYLRMLDPVYAGIFGRSFALALLTTALTLALGYPFAYAMARLPEKWRGRVTLLVMAPFWTNSLIRLYGWTTLLGADGWINKALLALGLIDTPVKLLYTFGAVVVGLVYALLPIMILAVYNSTEKLDWSQIEAARDLGAGRLYAFITVTLPQCRPGILAGCVLVLVPSMGLFFISDLLGGSKTMLLGNLIQNEMQAARNWPFGAALSVVMLLLAVGVIFLYRKSGDENGWGAML